MSKVSSDETNLAKINTYQRKLMESISIRYGENLTLPIDAGDVTAVSADIYIGKPGETYVLTKSATLTEGLGVFVFSSEDTKLPLDTYYYQINVTDSDGYIEKYPSPDEDCYGCEADFPQFIVGEALDQTEVS